MSLNVKKVWLKNDDQEVLVNASDIRSGDTVVVHMGNVILLTVKYPEEKAWSTRRRSPANPFR